MIQVQESGSHRIQMHIIAHRFKIPRATAIHDQRLVLGGFLAEKANGRGFLAIAGGETGFAHWGQRQ